MYETLDAETTKLSIIVLSRFQNRKRPAMRSCRKGTEVQVQSFQQSFFCLEGPKANMWQSERAEDNERISTKGEFS